MENREASCKSAIVALKDISSAIQSKSKNGMVESTDIDEYVQDALFLFQKSRNLVSDDELL